MRPTNASGDDGAWARQSGVTSASAENQFTTYTSSPFPLEIARFISVMALVGARGCC